MWHCFKFLDPALISPPCIITAFAHCICTDFHMGAAHSVYCVHFINRALFFLLDGTQNLLQLKDDAVCYKLPQLLSAFIECCENLVLEC